MKNNRINEALYADKRPEFLEHKNRIATDLGIMKKLVQKLASETENPVIKEGIMHMWTMYDKTTKDMWNAIRMVAKMHDGNIDKSAEIPVKENKVEKIYDYLLKD